MNMNLSGQPVRWSLGASDLLRQFLESPVGEVFLARVMNSRPPLVSGPDLNAAALRGAEAKGYETAISVIISMLSPDQAVITEGSVSSGYPSLDNDAAWADGQKTGTPPS